MIKFKFISCLSLFFFPMIFLAQNKLINENSLYLRQHATNPINWNPWNNKALIQAKNEQKLIIVSVGYSSCHWCHIMEEETFQDNEVAFLMNKYFVSIKVDREERPDIDAHYMKALKTITGKAGWPMNIVALPDGRTIWAGTYVDKTQWLSTLKQLSLFYEKRKSDLNDHANKIEQGISQSLVLKSDVIDSVYSKDYVEDIINKFNQGMDMQYGGFGKKEKFMSPIILESLLRYAVQVNSSELKYFLKKTLNKIIFGGVNDQIGGGFHRYSVDRRWKVPHFEKMLYDNAQMLSLFSQFYRVFKDDLYKDESYKILRFLNREMKDSSQLFYSSIAADNFNVKGLKKEGDFYTWSREELKSILKNDFIWFSDYYSLYDNEIWEDNKFILFRQTNDSIFANKYNWSRNNFKTLRSEVNEKLYLFRQKKSAPIVDQKIIFSWNALAVKGMIDAYKSFGDIVFLEQAGQTLNLLLSDTFYKEKRISHTKNTTESLLLAEDYVFLIDALISYYEVTANESKLILAKDLADFTLKTFTSENGVHLKFSSEKKESITKFLVQYDDNFLPSTNSKMAENLFKLNHFFGYSEYKERAKKMTSLVKSKLYKQPLKHANWMHSVYNFTFPFYEIAVTGPSAIEKMNLLLPFYLPDSVISTSASTSDLYLLKGRYDPINTFYYVCVDNFCKIPVQTINDFFTLLQAKPVNMIYNEKLFQ